MITWLKHHFHEVMAIKTTPHEIALGFAVGAAIAILPTPGISFFLGFLIILIYERISKISLFAALALFNPLVMAPVYLISYSLGNYILGNAPVEVIEISLFSSIWQYTKRYLIGNAIIAIGTAIISYFILKYSISKFQKRKHI